MYAAVAVAAVGEEVVGEYVPADESAAAVRVEQGEDVAAAKKIGAVATGGAAIVFVRRMVEAARVAFAVYDVAVEPMALEVVVP